MTSIEVRRARTILFPFVGAEIGGSHVSAFTLAQALVSEFGYDCRVLCAPETLIAHEAERRGLTVVASGEPPTPRHSPRYDALRFRSRRELLRALPPDVIVHVNDLSAIQSWGPVARLGGRPIVYHHRSLNRMTLPKRLLVHLADRVVCISRRCLENVAFVAAKRRSFVLNPVRLRPTDRTAARVQVSAEFAIPNDRRLVGFVGNFWHRKRPLLFLDLARLLARQRPDLHFVMFGRAGDLTETDVAAAVAERGIAERVTLAGFRLPVERNIAALDLLLAPALAEPFGRTLVEAAILGTPYLATDDAGHREIFDLWRGGLLVAVGEGAEAFVAPALAILERPTNAVLDHAARASLVEDLSAGRHARLIAALYAELQRPSSC